MTTDRDLLLGLLALQNGLIDQVQLVAAFHAWGRDRSRGLAEHLAARGDLDAEGRAAMEALVALHLRRHAGDAERSLASLTVPRATRDRLAATDDLELSITVTKVGSSATEPDAERTSTYGGAGASGGDGRFRVLRPHARGGLGEVFVALDGELNREVALKQILDHHADDAMSRHRFLVEAEITGGLEHPGIVPVYGLGTDVDGRPYYAMRFVRGDSLKEAIGQFHGDASFPTHPGRRTLALRKLLRRFLDVCNTIEYAHSRGVLHRDIKPSNVIVGKHGETLVVDWGLARAQGRAGAGAPTEERPIVPSSASGSAETLPGSALGTPAYMSPEQARGDLEALGPRSDVYSLGATLYCLLTGRPPFEGDVAEVLRKVQKGDFARPRQAKPFLDPALEAVCLKAMATDPANRYATARELAEDVERWTADQPVSAYRDPLRRRLGRWARRNQGLVAVGLTALIVTTFGLGTWISAVDRERERAEQARLLAETAEGLSTAHYKMAADAIFRLMSQVQDQRLSKIPGTEQVRLELAEMAAVQYNSFLQTMRDDSQLLADGERLHKDLALIRWIVGNVKGARDAYTRAIELAQRLQKFNLDEPALEAMAGSKKVEDVTTLASNRARQLRLFECYRDRALFLYETGYDAEAESDRATTQRLADEWVARLPSLSKGTADSVRLGVGWWLARVGEYDERRGEAERARTESEAAIGLLAPLIDERNQWFWVRLFVSKAHMTLGLLARDEGRAEEADREFAEAEQIARAVHAEKPDHPDTPDALAWLLLNEAGPAPVPGRDAAADLARLDEAVALYDRNVARSPGVIWYARDRATALRYRAGHHAAAGRVELAEKDLEESRRVLAYLLARFPDDHTYLGRLGRTELALARLRIGQGRGAEGRELLDAATAHLEKAVALRPGNAVEKASLDECRMVRESVELGDED